MKDFSGNPEFPIWLIGDSPPEAWADKLDTPLDPRHPARHSIWTSVADPMQDRLYRERKLRLDMSKLYIRNAMNHPLATSPIIDEQTLLLNNLLNAYKPRIVLTFGVNSFKVALFASGKSPKKFFETTRNQTSVLGEEFRSRVDNYDENQVNIIPLLHVSVALNFLSAHRDFVGANGQAPPNYFDYVGTKLADLLLAKFSDKSVWVN